MKTLTTKEKRPVPAARKAHPYVYNPMKPVQQAAMRKILRSDEVQAIPAVDEHDGQYEHMNSQAVANTAAPVISSILPGGPVGAAPIQRLENEEPEEELRRQPEEEEEEPVQAKLIQRQADNEEEKEPEEAIQRQPEEEEEEEEPVQAKLMQRQPDNEEEKEPEEAIQRQPEEEDEEEPVQAKRIQRQKADMHGIRASRFGDSGPRMKAQQVEIHRILHSTGAQMKPTTSKTQTQYQGGMAGPENHTGFSDHLKAGLEQLSGMDLSGVRVHRNSSKPTQLNALAYTQGQDIHVGPGQEKHLPHEGWHAVQQLRGRVKPTMQAKGVSINDDKGLEREADVMGAKSLQMKRVEQATTGSTQQGAMLWQREVGTKGESEVIGKAIGTSGEKMRLNFLSMMGARAVQPTNSLTRQPRGQLRAGLSSTPSIVQRVLNPTQEATAVAWTNARYDEASIRIIQMVTGVAANGVFNAATARAVAAFQVAQGGLTEDGLVGTQTLNRIVPNRVATARHEHAIKLVIDYYNLRVGPRTLSVHFDAALATAGATAFESGNLRVITVGLTAFANARILRRTINRQLAVRAPRFVRAGPRPTHLTTAQEQAATAFNQTQLQDPRAIRAIQGVVRTSPDAIFGPDTAERIAEAQDTAGLPANGQINQATLEVFSAALIAANHQNALIRVILDFFNIGDAGNLLDVFFDPTVVGRDAVTDFRPNEPVRVRIGPSTFAEPFNHMVQIIAHEFEHVRRLRQGIVDRHTHEFLGFANEIATPGLPPLGLEPVAGLPCAFACHARIARIHWNSMPLADRRANRARFIQVRTAVRTTIAAGTAAQQALHAAELAAYNAVVVPPP